MKIEALENRSPRSSLRLEGKARRAVRIQDR
jgi:hypothetical protein